MRATRTALVVAVSTLCLSGCFGASDSDADLRSTSISFSGTDGARIDDDRSLGCGSDVTLVLSAKGFTAGNIRVVVTAGDDQAVHDRTYQAGNTLVRNTGLEGVAGLWGLHINGDGIDVQNFSAGLECNA